MTVDPLTSVIAEAMVAVDSSEWCDCGYVDCRRNAALIAAPAAVAVRAYLTTPDTIERAARELRRLDYGKDGWDAISETGRNAWRSRARRALAAVLDEGGTE